MGPKHIATVAVIGLQVMSIAFLGTYYYPRAATTSISQENVGNKGKLVAALVCSDVGDTTETRNTQGVVPRGSISGCTADDLKKRPNVVMLISTNTGFMDMTMNVLESIKRTGLCLNTSIVAEDKKAFRYLLKRAKDDPAIHTSKTIYRESSTAKLKFFGKDYHKLITNRYNYILDLLKQGFDVLFTDVDTFWFRDPFTYFEGDFDMSFVDERSPYPHRLPKKSGHCAGLGYYKPTNKTIQFVKKWVEILASKTNWRSDQGVLNYLLRGDIPMHVDVRPLPLAHFPHALIFYKPEWRKQNNDTIIHHGVGLREHDTKVQKFKENNMWLVGNFTMDE